jgi:hypothetical protein
VAADTIRAMHWNESRISALIRHRTTIHMVYLLPIWYIFGHSVYFCQFGTFMVIGKFFPVLVSCIKKNLATLHRTRLFPPFFGHCSDARRSRRTVSHLTRKSWTFVDGCRVARWFVFKPKIQICVNFGGSCNGRCWYILWTVGPIYDLFIFYGHLV